MKRKYYPVNLPFLYENELIMAVPTPKNEPVCTKCYFSNWERRGRGLPEISCCVHGCACTASIRKDKRHVIFVKAK